MVQKNTDSLKKLTEDFKQCSKNTFATYESSRLCTTKFHAVDHLGDETLQMESVHSLNSFPFEQSHEKFKEGYKKTSQRSVSVMKETINIVLENRKRFRFQQHENTKKILKMNPQLRFAISNDTSRILGQGTDTNLIEIENVLRHTNLIKKKRFHMQQPLQLKRR